MRASLDLRVLLPLSTPRAASVPTQSFPATSTRHLFAQRYPAILHRLMPTPRSAQRGVRWAEWVPHGMSPMPASFWHLTRLVLSPALNLSLMAAGQARRH